VELKLFKNGKRTEILQAYISFSWMKTGKNALYPSKVKKKFVNSKSKTCLRVRGFIDITEHNNV
jgi:hypothetical protein